MSGSGTENRPRPPPWRMLACDFIRCCIFGEVYAADGDVLATQQVDVHRTGGARAGEPRMVQARPTSQHCVGHESVEGVRRGRLVMQPGGLAVVEVCERADAERAGAGPTSSSTARATRAVSRTGWSIRCSSDLTDARRRANIAACSASTSPPRVCSIAGVSASSQAAVQSRSATGLQAGGCSADPKARRMGARCGACESRRVTQPGGGGVIGSAVREEGRGGGRIRCRAQTRGDCSDGLRIASARPTVQTHAGLFWCGGPPQERRCNILVESGQWWWPVRAPVVPCSVRSSTKTRRRCLLPP